MASSTTLKEGEMGFSLKVSGTVLKTIRKGRGICSFSNSVDLVPGVI